MGGVRESAVLLAFAKYPNVAIKATATPDDSSKPSPLPEHPRAIRQIYDAFGPHRMFWGTDITRMPCSWHQAVTFFTEEYRGCRSVTRRSSLGRLYARGFGWKLPAR